MNILNSDQAASTVHFSQDFTVWKKKFNISLARWQPGVRFHCNTRHVKFYLTQQNVVLANYLRFQRMTSSTTKTRFNQHETEGLLMLVKELTSVIIKITTLHTSSTLVVRAEFYTCCHNARKLRANGHITINQPSNYRSSELAESHQSCRQVRRRV